MRNALRRLKAAALLCLAAHIASSATAAPILIGQSAGFTGGQATYSADLRVGLEAGFEAVNRQGGIHGRRLKLVSLDDQGKKQLVLANTRRLVEQERAFALIGYTSGAGVEASLDYLNAAKVPMLAPATGNMGIRTGFHRYLFHTRAGYDAEIRRLIEHFRNMGVQRFAVAYLGDVGPANPRALHDALSAAGLQAVADVPLDRNATDFTPQIAALAAARPEAVIFISNAPPVATIVKALRERGYSGYIATSSFCGMSVLNDLGEHARGLVMVQVLPVYWRDSLPLVKQYRQHLQDHAPGAAPNYTSLEGYVAARVLAEGLRRAGHNPSREQFVNALEKLNTFDLGGYEISFSPKTHDGSRFVDTGVVNEQGRLQF